VHADVEIHASMAARLLLTCHEKSNVTKDMMPERLGCNMVVNKEDNSLKLSMYSQMAVRHPIK
jgi:hypothetical protein